jgi:hypothetical protein
MHWFEQLLGEGEVVQPFEGSRRGWNNWGGYETRGVYCVLPTAQKKAETEAERQAELARGAGSAHCDPQPSSMVVACCKTAELVSLLRFTTLSMQVGKMFCPRDVVGMLPTTDIDEVPEQGGGFCIFPRSHRELFARDSAFADMAHASFNYPDEKRAIAQGAPPNQVKFVGAC